MSIFEFTYIKLDKLIAINLQVYTMFQKKKIWIPGAFPHVDIENMDRGFFLR